MPIATATGLAIAGLIGSGASQIFGAHVASKGSKDAAKIQTDAADRARVEIDKARKVADDVYAPYVAAGRSATSTLGRLVTPGAGARYASAGPAPAPPPPDDRAIPRRSMGVGARADMGGDGTMPNEGLPQRPRTIGGMVPRGGGMVMLEANDGSGTRPVPSDQADRFLSTGNFRRAA